MSRIYLDSNIIIESIIDGPTAKSDAKRDLYRVCHSYTEIIIPQIILGESFLKILQRSETHEIPDNMTNFWKCIRETIQDMTKHTPPLSREILDVALRIRDNDYVLDYNDAVLVAHAITDKESTALFTSDKGIHNSLPIRNLINERKVDGNPLKILESV
ncbi:MAG: type II toxin-antitoxin system VapC family toxin [Candidatus Nitrosopolaris sp.]